jgi:hypothetical protein
MQGKPKKIPWISLDSFGRIGTFQWVITNPNKKTAALLNSPPGLYSRKIPQALSLPASPVRGPPHSAREKTLSHISIYSKENENARLLSR